MLAVLRMAVGVLFLVSGIEKALSPYQNFAYVIEAYQLLPRWLELIVAQAFPWLEIFAGAFLVLGLWLRLALAGAMAMFLAFVMVVGQALLRRLPLEQCGCFGELLHIPPQVIIVFDSAMVYLVYLMLKHPARSGRWGLDQYFLNR